MLRGLAIAISPKYPYLATCIVEINFQHAKEG